MKHTIEITSLAYGGDGIGRIEGQVCFVPFGLPGDVVTVEIVRKAKGVLWGKICEVVEASPDRIQEDKIQDTDSAGDGALRGTPSGPDTGEHAGVCGGCMWSHFAYPAQGAWKQRLVREALARYGGVETEVAWSEVPDLRLGWRTRAEVHGDGRRLGFYGHGTHEIVETRCPLLHPKLADAIDRLRAAGWRREVTLTANPDGDDVLAFGRWPSERAPIDRAAVQAAVTAWDDPRDDEENRSHFVYEGVPIWNGTFSQAGLELNRLLREVVSECVQGTGALFDAYCGNGNLSLAYLTTREVVGVDVSEVAVRGAKARGGDYRAGDEWAMGQCLRERNWGTIVLDPPRAGAKTLVPALAQARAEEMVYVGCDPVALARDLKGVVAGGWKVERVVALDLFPNTAHVETVVRLVR